MSDAGRSNLLSEEDIRVQIVSRFLRDHGFTAAQLRFEFVFKIWVSRREYTVGSVQPIFPRADVLVRNADGDNLLIVEVKSPNDEIDKRDQEQGITYARLLGDGGIAPFVIVTNGRETQIYDTVTRARINGESIPIDHPHVRNGFRVTGEELRQRMEALEAFVALSSENLVTFCRHQAAHRMEVLRSDDPASGRKYVPSLYVERSRAREELAALLERPGHIILVVGPPQVGKTNFICHTVESLLNQQRACLFYPAIGLNGGLLAEMAQDFEWDIGASATAYHVAKNLSRIATRTKQTIVIFIDGWNEASQRIASTLDAECSRLTLDNLKVVLSLTTVAAPRLLVDARGNLSYIANAAGLSRGGVALLNIDNEGETVKRTTLRGASEIDPEKDAAPSRIVRMSPFSADERDAAYLRYASVYNVSVPSGHDFTSDPFLLRVAMENSAGGSLPEKLDEPACVEGALWHKIGRSGLTPETAHLYLIALGRAVFDAGVPVPYDRLSEYCGDRMDLELPSELFEAALLARVQGGRSVPSIDFYFGRERDYVIAVWVRGWPKKLENVNVEECLRCAKSSERLEALGWFFTQPAFEGHLRVAVRVPMREYADPTVRKLLLAACTAVVARIRARAQPNERGRRKMGVPDWIAKLISSALADPDRDFLVRAESAKLAAVAGASDEELATEIITDTRYVRALLEIEAQYPLHENGPGSMVLRAFSEFDRKASIADECDSRAGDCLEELTCDSSALIATAAAKAFAHVCPRRFLQRLCEKVTRDRESLQTSFWPDSATPTSEERHLERVDDTQLAFALQLAERTIGAVYYGDLCPGLLDSLEEAPQRASKEYEAMAALCDPWLQSFRRTKGGAEFQHLLDKLRELAKAD